MIMKIHAATDLDLKPFTSTSDTFFKRFLVWWNVHLIQTNFSFFIIGICRKCNYLKVSLSNISHIWRCHNCWWKATIGWLFYIFLCHSSVETTESHLKKRYFVDLHDVIGILLPRMTYSNHVQHEYVQTILTSKFWKVSVKHKTKFMTVHFITQHMPFRNKSILWNIISNNYCLWFRIQRHRNLSTI